MDYEWDPAKAEGNLRKNGISFDTIADFDWESAVIVADDRRDCGEPRYLATGFIDTTPCSLAFTIRAARVRVISLRAAGRKERTFYERSR
jgi:uncharacterized DUF497 family protein